MLSQNMKIAIPILVTIIIALLPTPEGLASKRAILFCNIFRGNYCSYTRTNPSSSYRFSWCVIKCNTWSCR